MSRGGCQIDEPFSAAQFRPDKSAHHYHWKDSVGHRRRAQL